MRVVLQQNKWTRVESQELLITRYPFSVSVSGHYWQAMDLELELNLTGASVITRLDTHRTEAHTLSVSLCM